MYVARGPGRAVPRFQQRVEDGAEGVSYMGRRVITYVYAQDPVFQVGIAAQLRPRPEIDLVDDDRIDDTEVAIVIADDIDDSTTRIIRAIQRNGCPRVVLVVSRLDDSGVFAALEAGACGLLRREEATAERLVSMVQSAANGDGSVPPDNPFVGRANVRPEIFTWGHRNPQGLALHPETGRMWESEHGPRGGDELNLLKAGANYGWPRATHGIDYSGAVISPHKSLPGMEDPVRVWVPSISPSGLCFYTGDRFPGWKGSVFSGALSNFALFRIELDGERYLSEERLLVDRLPYIRDVRQGPDGLLYLVTHTDDGGLFRIEPA